MRSSLHVAAASIAAVLLLLPAGARADETNTWGQPAPLAPDEGEPTPAAPPPPVERRTTTTWYGWQTLLVDGLSIALVSVRPELGLAGYAVGAPIVHAANDRWGIAAASVSCRLGCPLVVALSSQGPSGRGGELSGLVAGAGVAMVLDAVVFSWKTTPVVVPRAEGGVDVVFGRTF
jgi:hypothetical protein